MWGNADGLYAVGTNGFIAHRTLSGSSWQKIESHTTLNIYDIWGDYNTKTKQWEILAVAANIGSSSVRKILKIDGSIINALPDYPIMYSLKSVWFIPNRQYYVVGSGIYGKRKLSDSNWKHDPVDITQYYTTGIRGNAINDVFACGAFGDMLHYNGISWISYRQQIGFQSGSYGNIMVTNNLVIAVGGKNQQAVITIGKRQ